MGKDKMSKSVLKKNWIKDLGTDCLSIEGGSIFCQVCQKSVNASKKFQVSQHLSTNSHGRNYLRFKKKPEIQTFLTNDSKRPHDTFNEELCEAILAAGIPWNKVNNPVFKAFIEKYCKRNVPEESTLRKRYLEICYQKSLQKIRDEIGNNFIWISVDETTDATGRYVANAVVGKLKSDEPSTSHLIASLTLEKTNNETIARFVNDAVSILWPGNIQYEKVLVFATDGAAYMVKAARALKVFYPNMVHVTCLAHGLHRVAETIRDSFPDVDKLVSSVKKVFVKCPSRVHIYKVKTGGLALPPEPILTRWGTWLHAVKFYAENWAAVKSVVESFADEDAKSIVEAKKKFSIKVSNDVAYIAENFAFLESTIQKLEEKGLSLREQINLVENAKDRLTYAGGEIGRKVLQKMETILNRNGGYNILKSVNEILAGNDSNENTVNMSPDKCINLTFAPLTSVDVERSFSMFKYILTDRSHKFTAENLNKILVCYCFKRRSDAGDEADDIVNK